MKAELPSLILKGNIMDERIIARNLDNQRFHLIIMPTEKCNFRCTYCYEDFENGKMSRDVIDGIKSLILFRAPDLHTLEIGWFGGEPLLNLKVVEEISEFSKKIMQYSKGLFISSMSTNGYLLDLETARSLTNKGVSVFQISIDGDRLTHDRSRILASGCGSFDRIWQNLLNIRNSDLNILLLLRVHITMDNIHSMEKIAVQINSAFAGDQRFKVYVQPVENLGGSSVKSLKLFSEKKSDDIRLIVESYFSSNLISNYSKSNPNVCYAAAANSLVIRSTGEVSKCTVLLKDSDNKLGKISSAGNLEINNALYGKWVSGLFDEKSASCPVQHVKSLTNT